MAFVNGKWLNNTDRAIRINLLSQRVKKLKVLRENGHATEYHVETLLNDLEELKRLIRVHKSQKDVGFFTYTYLSEELNPENEDNIVRHSDTGRKHSPFDEMAPIHRNFFDLCNHVTNEKINANLAIGAPRGHSKSGMFTNALPLHATVFRLRKYILVISETDSLSKKLIGWVNRQLKFNEKLREDFGELMFKASSRNEKDNEEAFITSTNTLIEASSSGKALRGKRHGAYRPDLVLIDDPSSTSNEGTKEAREKLIDWFNQVVVPIGSDGTAIVLVGTMVSATGLLNHVLNRRDFRSILYDAIIEEPDNPSLWEKYLEVYTRCEDISEADEFYETHRAQLEKGVEVAWSWRWTYRDLMHKKVDMGTKAFNSEYRNRAYSEDERFFFTENFAYYTYRTNLYGERVLMHEGKEYRLKDMTISGSWDIAMGKNARSCYNAVVTLGRHEESGLIFVLDEYASKEPPHKLLDVIIERIKRFRHHIFKVETINAQHEFYRQLIERCRVEGLYSTKIVDVKGHKSSKDARIESLEPLCHNRTIVFNERHTILLNQMEQYPNGDYVDSIDALQIALEDIVRRKVKVIGKPAYLR